MNFYLCSSVSNSLFFSLWIICVYPRSSASNNFFVFYDHLYLFFLAVFQGNRKGLPLLLIAARPDDLSQRPVDLGVLKLETGLQKFLRKDPLAFQQNRPEFPQDQPQHETGGRQESRSTQNSSEGLGQFLVRPPSKRSMIFSPKRFYRLRRFYGILDLGKEFFFSPKGRRSF